MALKIRLRQQGRTHSPFYRVVVMDCRHPRDGQYIESLGWYNPQAVSEEHSLAIKADRVQHWLNQGAILTEKAESLVAKAAPAVVKSKQEKEMAKQAKRRTQRRAYRKTKASA